jgi:uncharacterized membrane protein YoaK (UPF0700 family)
MTRPSIAVPLSFNAGYVDTAGFLALQGLFTAHVTGNFVTLGATLVLGTSGAIGKLLALPVFCVVVVLVRGIGSWLAAHSLPQLRTLLTVKIVLLAIGSALAVRLGLFRDAYSWPALVSGMTLVSAMAIQNALQRIHLATSPPTTLMTGTTTQIMIDLADTMHGRLSPDQRLIARRRLSRMVLSVIAFGLGCGVAASLYALVNIWCLLIPPLFALTTYFCRVEAMPARADEH